MKKLFMLIVLLSLVGCKHRDYTITVVDNGKVIQKSCVLEASSLPTVQYEPYSHIPYIYCKNGNINGYNRLVILGWKEFELQE